MKVYIRTETDRKKLADAEQGLAAVVSDLENLDNGRNARHDPSSPRLKYEGGALCQADNKKKAWHSRGRFVWGLSSDGKSALLVGHVPEHDHGKYKTDYDKLKADAKAVGDSDFKDAIEMESSEEIQRQEDEKKAARQATKKKKFDWKNTLQEAYHAAQEEFGFGSELAGEYFEEIVKSYLKDHGELTDPNRGSMARGKLTELENDPRFDPQYKQALREACEKMEIEATGTQDKQSQTNDELAKAQEPSLAEQKASNHQLLSDASQPLSQTAATGQTISNNTEKGKEKAETDVSPSPKIPPPPIAPQMPPQNGGR